LKRNQEKRQLISLAERAESPIFAPKITDMNMETTKKKRTREEVRAAFKDYLRRKKEFEEQAVLELKQMSQQGFFDRTDVYA